MSKTGISRKPHVQGRCLRVLPVVLLGACATEAERPYWGESATIAPGWERVSDAALKALKDPFTWGPAAGAAVLQIGDIDAEIAEWANDETPLFGSRDAASDAG